MGAEQAGERRGDRRQERQGGTDREGQTERRTHRGKETERDRQRGGHKEARTRERGGEGGRDKEGKEEDGRRGRAGPSCFWPTSGQRPSAGCPRASPTLPCMPRRVRQGGRAAWLLLLVHLADLEWTGWVIRLTAETIIIDGARSGKPAALYHPGAGAWLRLLQSSAAASERRCGEGRPRAAARHSHSRRNAINYNLVPINRYLYKVASGQICRSRDQLGSQAGVPVRQMAGPNPLKGPTNILELR